MDMFVSITMAKKELEYWQSPAISKFVSVFLDKVVMLHMALKICLEDEIEARLRDVKKDCKLRRAVALSRRSSRHPARCVGAPPPAGRSVGNRDVKKNFFILVSMSV